MLLLFCVAVALLLLLQQLLVWMLLLKTLRHPPVSRRCIDAHLHALDPAASAERATSW